jgi:hypothetical protein
MADCAQIPGKQGGCPQKMRTQAPGPHPAPQAEESPLNPSAQSGGIGQARRIFAVRHGLLSRVAGTDSVTGLLSTAQGIVSRGYQPVGQNGEGLPARPTNPTPHPDMFAPVVVCLTKSPTVANDRGVSAKRTSPRQAIQRNYPGSLLSLGSGSAINRTTAGLQPPPLTVPCQRFNLVARPSLLRQSQFRTKRILLSVGWLPVPHSQQHWPV